MEYIKKLLECGVRRDEIVVFITDLLNLGVQIYIKYYHLSNYPIDRDDICFLLVAENGKASHLVSYDAHLVDLDGKFQFKNIEAGGFFKGIAFGILAIESSKS